MQTRQCGQAGPRSGAGRSNRSTVALLENNVRSRGGGVQCGRKAIRQ